MIFIFGFLIEKIMASQGFFVPSKVFDGLSMEGQVGC